MTEKSNEHHSNFIRNMIQDDLEQGKHQQVVTRFPPEPNGYLHIGHAKAVTLNFTLANEFGGRCHMRFDDTNPLKEDEEYAEAIMRDIKWLGFDWGEHLYYASDYFERFYELAVKLIRDGLAYVDSLSKEEIREYRGNFSTPGKESPYRDRSVEENLALFKQMREGKFKEGEHVLRAKIDMQSPNMVMRDPLLYRIIHSDHYRAGDQWCIYPMYDYAHPLEDAFEGVTHSLCSLEFENNRELYDWVVKHTGVAAKPEQTEFARLAVSNTVTSKRKLLQLVQEGHVSGWDDPRMPTLAGLRRRGVTPEAIRHFCEMVGVARANSMVGIDKLEFCIRDDLNHKAPRVMCVIDPIKVVLTNYPEDKREVLDASLWPHDVPKEGTRELPFGRELYIERADFMETRPNKKWRRLSVGGAVRLRHAYIIDCHDVVKDNDGNIIEVHCTYDADTKSGTGSDRKVKGTIHWVSVADAVPATIRVYDRLFLAERPDGDPDVDFKSHLNPNSLIEHKGFVEPSIQNDPVHSRYQFERNGYFFSDDDSTPEALLFNQTVSLKDSWSKIQAKQNATPEAKKPEPKKVEPKQTETKERPNKKTRAQERENARAEEPALQAAYDRYLNTLKLDEEFADVLSGEVALVAFYDDTLKAYDKVDSVTNWVINELMRLINEASVEALSFTPAQFARLVEMVDQNTISNVVAKDVLDIMAETGDDADAIVERKGLGQINDEAKLASIIDEVLAANDGQVQAYRGGKTKLMGFFVGQVMKQTKGKANPQMAKTLLVSKLDG